MRTSLTLYDNKVAYEACFCAAPRSEAKLLLLGSLLEIFKYLILAISYSPLASTIATTMLNFRVRNENGCFHSVKSPELNIRRTLILYQKFLTGQVGMLPVCLRTKQLVTNSSPPKPCVGGRTGVTLSPNHQLKKLNLFEN